MLIRVVRFDHLLPTDVKVEDGSTAAIRFKQERMSSVVVNVRGLGLRDF